MLSCDAAAAIAAGESGVPLPLLRAITRAETGRGRPSTPWSWTVNVDGRGHWFADRKAAITFVETQLAAGYRSIDIGCFQMNLRWHGHRFASPAQMFDPLANARAAAGFLNELLDSEGNWTAATAAYHSRSPELGQAYLRRVLAELPSEVVGQPVAPDAVARNRINRFPLLDTGAGGGRMASLVPELNPGTPIVGGK